MSWRAKYIPLKRLGGGSYGEVWLVRDHFGREFALKRITSLLPVYIETLFGEADKLWRLLDVPGVVRLIDHDIHCSEPYIVLERADRSLHDRLAGRAQPSQFAAAIGLQLARAVRNAHACEILHLDLKPENVLLMGGELRIADFGSSHGMASLVVSGGGGTPGYIAPERAWGATTDAADIYAVGAVLYQVLTGQRPPANRSALDPRWIVASCPWELAQLVLLMTSPQPQDRPDLDWVERICREFMRNYSAAQQPAQNRVVPAATSRNAGPALVLGGALGAAAFAVGGPIAAGAVALVAFLLVGRRR